MCGRNARTKVSWWAASRSRGVSATDRVPVPMHGEAPGQVAQHLRRIGPVDLGEHGGVPPAEGLQDRPLGSWQHVDGSIPAAGLAGPPSGNEIRNDPEIQVVAIRTGAFS